MSNGTDTIHKFQRVGLGDAPFRVVGFTEIVYQACPGAPVQAGGSCAYCGTGIRYAAKILSADGKRFVVGMDCVNKTGDAGLVSAVKRTPEYKKHKADLRAAKDARVKAEIATLLEKLRDNYSLAPRLEYVVNVLRMCGAAGRVRYLKQLRELDAEDTNPPPPSDPPCPP